MRWQEDEAHSETKITAQIIDLAFEINCPMLPLDHAYALSEAVKQAIPWFDVEPLAGLHLIRGANSGNGWQRSETEDTILHLSRRNKLVLRLPLHRVFEAQVLRGMTLNIDTYLMQVGKATQKNLLPTPVLFARYVQADSSQTEDEFLDHAVDTILKLGVECRKVLCGKNHYFKHPQHQIFTRSLMIADLKQEDSVILQQYGLGDGRKMGFGLFLPHKDIKSLDASVNMEKVSEV
jgi:CRISPR-associated protein Cas6